MLCTPSPLLVFSYALVQHVILMLGACFLLLVLELNSNGLPKLSEEGTESDSSASPAARHQGKHENPAPLTPNTHRSFRSHCNKAVGL